MANKKRHGSEQQVTLNSLTSSSYDIRGVSLTAENYPPDIAESLARNAAAFESAAREIDSGVGTEASDGASFRSQARNVKVWANTTGNLITDQYFQGLQVISESTSEHKVYSRESDNRAVKKTWAGVYGQIPTQKDGKLDRKNATPAEYLRRMSLQIVIFGSDIRLEGVFISDEPSMIIGEESGQPSFVISQAWVQKAGSVTKESIAEFLTEEGFVEVPNAYFGWFRQSDNTVIVDAKPDNFIWSEAGLIPIDLQMAVFDEQQAIDAGLNDLSQDHKHESLIITSQGSKNEVITEQRPKLESLIITPQKPLIIPSQKLKNGGSLILPP